MADTEEATVEQTSTEEAQADAKGELDQLRTELEQVRKGLSTAHQTITQKDRDLKKQQDLETRISQVQDTVELLATAIASQGISTEEPENRQDIVKSLKAQREKQEAERQAAQTQREREEYLNQADVIYAEAKEVFKNDEDTLEKIEDQLMSMIPERMARAKAKIDRAKAQSKPKEEAVDLEKLKEELKREIMEERGELVSDVGGAAGSAGDIIDWSEVQGDAKKYREAFPGGHAEFQEKLAAGKIKNI